MDNTLGSKEIFMFYNVENFFASDPQPQHKNDPSASGLKNWNDWRFNNKVNKITSVFSLLKEQTGKLPLIIGLSEIQGDDILNDLVSGDVFAGNYAFIHYDSLDERGVDVALVYNKEFVKIVHSEPISFFFDVDKKQPGDYDTTRDVLFCKTEILGEVVNFFVLHLPSKRGNDINKEKRDYILKHILEDRAMPLIHNHEPVLLMGDFNQNPDEENMNAYYKDQEFYNPFADLYDGKIFSTFHRGEGLLFDQMVLSRQFLDENAGVKFDNAEVFNPEQISNQRGKFSGEPLRTYAGTRYLGGYSDHFPVYTVFNFKK